MRPQQWIKNLFLFAALVFSGNLFNSHDIILTVIGFFLFSFAASGIYLYAFFETSVGMAYRSVESLTHDQWYAGGLMRSLHRYASDALLVVMVPHLARELTYGRFKGFCWFAWVTGIPLIVLTVVAGAGG